MIIKPQKLVKSMFIIQIVSGIMCILMFLIMKSLYGSMIISGVIIFYLVFYYLSFFRVIILDENGCTLKCRLYEKHYTWDDFKVKKIRRYRHAYDFDLPYKEFFEFAIKDIRRYKYSDPTKPFIYHPFTLVFAFLSKPTDPAEEKIANEYYYKVDKDEFLRLMDSWNIVLEREI